MITFKYDKKIEQTVFDDYVKPKKSPEVASLIFLEINEVEILSERDVIISKLVSHIENGWQKVANNFYNKLGKFYGLDISEPDLTCYLIRLDIFPYSYLTNKEKWFAAPLFGNPADRIRVIMHELCHFFQPLDLPRDIKEAIPVILNDHEAFQMYSFDRGHGTEEEKKWRKIIWDIYQSGGGFQDIIDKLKKEGILS